MINIDTYDTGVQKLFMQTLLYSDDMFARCRNMIEPGYFEQPYENLIKFVMEYSEKYNAIPNNAQIKATIDFSLDEPDDDIHTDDYQEWFLEEFERFCRYKGLEKGVYESVDVLSKPAHEIDKTDYGIVEENIKKASQIGLVRDLGTDYFANPKEMLEQILERDELISTGWQDIDYKLYGGMNRGEITIFCGGSGSGKSLFLQNLALNWSAAKFNVLYVTMELNEKLVFMRMAAMQNGISTKDVKQDIVAAALKIEEKRKRSGRLVIKQMPNGINVNDIRAYIREYEIKYGEKFDALLIDYLDLMMPISKKIKGDDLFTKDKFVTEEIRNLAMERNFLCATASQLNRSAVDEIEFDHSHIAGGLSKIQTADNVIGILTSKAMREKGRYQVQFMKTRSSSGVGAKIPLKFDINSMRITDSDESEEESTMGTAMHIVDTLKRDGVVKSDMTAAEEVENKAMNLQAFIKNRKL